MIKQVLMVFFGGGIGSICRFLIGRAMLHFWKNPFPIGTFMANVLGCLLIGILYGYFQKSHLPSQQWSLLLITGFCGGFTTFSSFANENLLLIKGEQFLYFIGYTAFSVLLGFGAVAVGWWVSLKF